MTTIQWLSWFSCRLFFSCGELCVSGSIVDYDYDIHKITPTATDLVLGFFYPSLVFIHSSSRLVSRFYYDYYDFLVFSFGLLEHLGSKFNGFTHQYMNISHHFKKLFFCSVLFVRRYFSIHTVHCNLVSFFCLLFSLSTIRWTKRHSILWPFIWINLWMLETQSCFIKWTNCHLLI